MNRGNHALEAVLITKESLLGDFEGIDHQIADIASSFLPDETDKETRRVAKLLFACCHQQTRNGHLLLDINQLSGFSHIGVSDDEILRFRKLFDELPESFREDPGNPIYWESRNVLYIRRLYLTEKMTAQKIAHMASSAEKAISEPYDYQDSTPIFRTLTPNQYRAATSPLNHRLVLISGGPGTGKTYTILQMIRFLHLQQASAIFQLLAPTGKAVSRIQESIRNGLSELSDASLLKQVRAATLHRYLADQERHTAYYSPYPNPKEIAQFVIVDEASMVDIHLLHRLISNLDSETHLVLMGDIHQLASVQPGSVFADTFEACASARKHVPSITLSDYFRFKTSPGIGQLCEHIRSGDTISTLTHLNDSNSGSVIRWISRTDSDTINQTLKDWVYQHILPVVGISDPVEALAHYNRSMILCAQNEGPYGVNALNRSILQNCRHEFSLHSSNGNQRSFWKPIMIRKNDYSLSLFNGDFGVFQSFPVSADINAIACFDTIEGENVFHTEQLLPPYSDAFAVTVHKSQGSEADSVLLLLSDQPNRILTRELFYTAVSRARRQLTIIGNSDIIQFCIENPTQRASRLGERIRVQLEHL